MRNPMELEGRHIIVTGAAQGIGRAITGLALELGAYVTLVDANPDTLRVTVAAFDPERVLGLAGMAPSELPRVSGRGGALVAQHSLSMQELQAVLDELGRQADQRVDLMTVLESRLFDQHIRKHMVPTQAPVLGKAAGSAFGWRIDPFTGQSALHTGLDFQADTGTPILAAAGGVVLAQEFHPAYGNMVEIDHGNQLVTRYAHASKTFVRRGDFVRRGQKIAEVGTTGRSTGAHLHFEVLVQGVPQDPQKFLAAGESASVAQAGRTRSRPVAGR